MTSNVQPIVEELISLKTKLEPLEKRFERVKETVREVGPDTYLVPGKGKVIVSAASEKKPKGTQVVIDSEKLDTADPELVAELFELGILKTETTYTRASKSKVEVKLEAA